MASALPGVVACFLAAGAHAETECSKGDKATAWKQLQAQAAKDPREIGPDGAILKVWWVPVDSIIRGVSGDELLIAGDLLEDLVTSSFDLAIRPEGALRAVPFSTGPKSIELPCPASLVSSDDVYLGCWKAVDRATGAERRLAYDANCT
jgi:hypothetical protein